MKKLCGQESLVEGDLPEMKDKEIAEKLERIWTLREDAKTHINLTKEVKKHIEGYVLGLSEQDQGIGQLKCGDFVLPFEVKMAEEKVVEYTTTAGKKVTLKLAPETDDAE